MTASHDGLTHEELVVLAALATVIMRADGHVEPGEVSAFLELPRSLVEFSGVTQPSGYRDAPQRGRPVDSRRWIEIYDQATKQLDSDERIKHAARAVQRPEARSLMYLKLWDLATVGTMGRAEQFALAWLREAWDLRY